MVKEKGNGWAVEGKKFGPLDHVLKILTLKLSWITGAVMKETDKDWTSDTDYNNISSLVKMFHKGMIIYPGIMHDLFT